MCVMRDDEPMGPGLRAVRNPALFTQGAPVLISLGIEPKTTLWLVQDRTTSPSGIRSPPRGRLVWTSLPTTH
jgi:hypothetical protein